MRLTRLSLVRRPCGGSGCSINAHYNHHFPQLLAGDSSLSAEQQGPIGKADVQLGNLWSTIFGRMPVPLPDNLRGGEVDVIIKDLV